MGLLNKEQLLSKQQVEIEKVDLGDGDFVYVREMYGQERDNFERSLMKAVRDSKGKLTGYEQTLEEFRAKFAAFTMCDEQGNLLLSQTDVKEFSKNISAARLIKIVETAQRLNKMSDEDKDAIIKNSGVGLADNFNSDSAEN